MKFNPPDLKTIRSRVKTAIPSTWKWKLEIARDRTIMLTIYSADIDLWHGHKTPWAPITWRHQRIRDITPERFNHMDLERWKGIIDALNFDRWSLAQIDAYITIRIGSPERPFKLIHLETDHVAC